MRPIDYFIGWMGRFGFPFGFFRLIKRDSSLLGPYHGSAFNPAYGIDQANNLRIVEYNIDSLVSFHWHIIQRNYNLLAHNWVVCLYGSNTVSQMIDVLLFALKCEAAHVPAA